MAGRRPTIPVNVGPRGVTTASLTTPVSSDGYQPVGSVMGPGHNRQVLSYTSIPLRTVMGLIPPASGTVKLFGDDAARLEAHKRPVLGIGYMPEDCRLVSQLTVEENVLLPSWVIEGLDHEASLQFIYDLMPELQAMKDRKALLLSGGQQKMAALGRALMVGTRLLALDERFEGVAPALAERLIEVIGHSDPDGPSGSAMSPHQPPFKMTVTF